MSTPNWNEYEPETEDSFTRTDRMMELPDVPVVEHEPDHPDASMLSKPKRKPNARKYEDKVLKVFGVATRVAISKPALVPDAAILLLKGPPVAEALGDLAAENEAVARMLTLSEQVTDNATLAAVTAISGLLMQIVRNHEPILEPAPRSFTVPFLKRTFKLPKIGVKLGLFRAATVEPNALIQHVFSDQGIIDALRKNGITLAPSD